MKQKIELTLSDLEIIKEFESAEENAEQTNVDQENVEQENIEQENTDPESFDPESVPIETEFQPRQPRLISVIPKAERSGETDAAKKKAEDERFNNIQKHFKQKTLRGRSLLNRILKLVVKGNTHAGQFNVFESLKIDDDWLINIEGHINHIDNIVRNPKSALKEERIIVNTSKAKKTDSETIRYLSSHTSDIESIKGDEIRPSRLNVREIDSDLCIYENRFVYALMVRLRSFLEQRYIAIKEQINCYDTNELKVASRIDTPNGDIEYDLRIKLRDKMSDSVSIKENAGLLERIESCRTHISALMSSEFARTLAKAKLLMPPINKTNAIRGHTDYRGCYNLWLFLSSYTAVGYSINIEEQNLELTDDYYDDLAFITTMSVKNMLDNNMINRSLFGVNQIRKKIKKCKPNKNFAYSTTKRNIGKVADEELINQLYYEKIKQLLKDSDNVKKQKDEELRIAFRTYYKKISSLNNSLYNEALELDNYREPIKNSSNLETKKQALAHCEEGLKRLRLLRSLKESDFRAAQREEEKLLERTARLNVQIKELREKQAKEELERRLEKERKALEQQESRRLAKLERQRLLAEKKVAAAARKIEVDRQRAEQKEKAAAEKLTRQRQAEQEREQARQKAAKEKERAKIQKQREKEKAAIAARKNKEKQKEQQRKKKVQEKFKKQKQLALQKEKNELKKQRELQKAKETNKQKPKKKENNKQNEGKD